MKTTVKNTMAGVTLTELLMAVAIIAILVSIGFPVVGKAYTKMKYRTRAIFEAHNDRLVMLVEEPRDARSEQLQQWFLINDVRKAWTAYEQEMQRKYNQ